MKKNMNTEQMPKAYLQKLSHILVAFLIILGVLFLLNQKPWAGYRISQFDGTHGHKEASWVLRQGDEILNPAVTLPAFLHLEKGQTYSISAPLTYDGTKDKVPFAFFYIHHMYCKAYLNNQLLFSYTPEDIQKTDSARSPGNVYVSFPIPADCLGKEFKLEFVPPLNIDMEYELPYPVFGDFPSEAHHTFLADLPHNLLAVLAGFIGVAAITFATMALKGPDYREALFMGIFALVFSIYNVTECNFNFYCISNPYYTYILNYTAFTLIPIFLMAFLRERLDPKQKPVGTAMLIIGSVLFVSEFFLHFTGRMDMREFLPILHISYFGELMVIFVLIITMKKNRWKSHLVFQMVPILIGMLLDAAVYYEHWTISKSDAAFTTIGVVIFLLIEFYHVWRCSIEIYTESIRSRDYQEMAYVDPLTGIGNRRAYEAEKEKILRKEAGFTSLTVASVDLNDLKYTNDNLGHAAGDFLIRSAAGLLSDLSQNTGTVYRVGGDEFLLFLYDLSEQALLEKIREMQREIEKINSNSEAKLSLAVGWEPMKDGDICGAISLADKKMYEEKARMKKRKAGAIPEDAPESE